MLCPTTAVDLMLWGLSLPLGAHTTRLVFSPRHAVRGFRPGQTAQDPGHGGGTVEELPCTPRLVTVTPPSRRVGVTVPGSGCRCHRAVAARSLGAAGAGRDLTKAGLASAQMGSGQWTRLPLWLGPQRAAWPGQPQALAATPAHLLEFQRQMF